ncbi:MAG: response regulator [Leptospiraceae bacterium]|nr:response regulator [Leptospiraceae bacterium]MCP5512621.1 response regulator [Leptospiraceae bacterium]
MQKVVLIDRDRYYHEELGEMLKDYNFIAVEDYHKGVDLCKTAAPDIIFLGIKPHMDPEAMQALRSLKSDLSTRKLPIIALYQSIDRLQIEKDRQDGIEYYLMKSANEIVVKMKVQECIKNAKAQKQYDTFKSKSHIHVDYTFHNVVKISFLSGLKYVLPQLNEIFNINFLRTLENREICLDIRDFTSVTKEESIVLEKIVSLFGKKKVAIIVGKHMGAIISLSNLEKKADLFLKIDDFFSYLTKPQTNPSIDSIS